MLSKKSQVVIGVLLLITTVGIPCIMAVFR